MPIMIFMTLFIIAVVLHVPITILILTLVGLALAGIAVYKFFPSFDKKRG